MRFAITIIVTSIVTLAGCSPCLEAFKRIEVGKPLPDKLPAGLYRTSIGLGCSESGPSLVPFVRWSRRLQVLTDDNGVVVGKATFDVRPTVEVGSIGAVIETTTLEVEVPPECWNEPSASWGRDNPPLDYLCLAAQLLEAVPVGAEGSSDEASGGEAPVASAPIWLASLGQHDPDLRQVISDGFRWQGNSRHLKVTCENLGARRVRLEVVMQGERRSFADGPLQELAFTGIVYSAWILSHLPPR